MKPEEKQETKGASLEIKEPTNKGFAIIYNPLKNDNSLTANEKAILWTLITAGPGFKPSYTGFEKILKLARATIAKAVKSLQNKGYLIIEGKETKGAKWRVIFDPMEEEREAPTFEALLNSAKRGIINLENLAELVKNHLIAREEARQIIEEAQAFAQRLATDFYGEN